jgi:nucleotide-binding universal stress UspA family protein
MHARISPEQERTTATGDTMQNILLPIDDTIFSYYAFQSAKLCLQKAQGRARLFLLHVDRPYGTFEKLTPQKKLDQYEEEALINASRLFAFYGQLCRENNFDVTLIRSIDAHPSNKINEAAKAFNIDLIILGQGGAATSGLTGAAKRKVVGSTTKAVLEHSPVDVTIVKRVYEDVNEDRFNKLLSERSPNEVVPRDQITEDHPFQVFQFSGAGVGGNWSQQQGLGTSQYATGQQYGQTGLGSSQYQHPTAGYGEQQGVGTQYQVGGTQYQGTGEPGLGTSQYGTGQHQRQGVGEWVEEKLGMGEGKHAHTTAERDISSV